MAAVIAPRQRSNTSTSATSSHATKSRSSTTSVQPGTGQPIHQYQHRLENPNQIQPQQQAYAAHLPFTPEQMITQNHQQFANPPKSYDIDPSLQNNIDHRRSLSFDISHGAGVTTVRPQIGHQQSFDGAGQQTYQPLNDDLAQDDTGTERGKKKKGSATSAANDAELRRLYNEHRGRPLKEVAGDVLVHERGPKSEKTKQIFAMLWLDSVCKKSNESVPRNRVYGVYSYRCGSERVPPLNPASFGKLVRIIFPGIQTRRLGMRGESKYHYVDLSLVDEQESTVVDTEEMQLAQDISVPLERPSLKRHRSQPPADSTAFPALDETLSAPIWTENKRRKTVDGSLFMETPKSNMDQRHTNSHLLSRELKWPTSDDEPYHENEPLNLPSITPHLPSGTDPDAANALIALYRSHCISVIDCFRFCKEKMLWHHFTAFHGTLTVPVQKLLAHPDIAAWIKESDWYMYQKMIRFVAPLAMQVVPHRVLDTFKNISQKLAKHISVTFQNLPQHVRDAKLEPAVLFAGLLDRLLRVNATAHAAANMLTNDANREQMWQDWCLFVKPGRVAESALRGVGFYRCLWILTRDVRNLLGPLECISYDGMDECFEKANNEAPPNWSSHAHPGRDDSTEGVLDRWTEFLHYLPMQFPQIDPREFIDRASGVCSAALRDITMAGALSFGSWWITKCWIDEMLMWNAEKGGFMDHKPGSCNKYTQSEKVAGDVGEIHDRRGDSRPMTAVSTNAESTANYASFETLTDQTPQPNSHMHHGLPNGLHQQGYQDSNDQGYNGPVSLQPTPSIQPSHDFDVAPPRQHQQPNLLRAQSYHPDLSYGSRSEAEKGQIPILHRAASANHLPQTNGAISHQHLDLDNHDDSGIHMGLEDDELGNMTKYGGFVAENLGSDPVDIRVC